MVELLVPSVEEPFRLLHGRSGAFPLPSRPVGERGLFRPVQILRAHAEHRIAEGRDVEEEGKRRPPDGKRSPKRLGDGCAEFDERQVARALGFRHEGRAA